MKANESVRWSKNWRLRLREARAIVSRALKLDVDRHVKRRDQLRVRALRLVEGVAQHSPVEGHEARWNAINRLRGRCVALEETCLGCAVSVNVPCTMKVRLPARAARALFDLTMRRGDEEFAKLPPKKNDAEIQWVHVDEDEIIGELLVREAKRVGPRRRRKRGKRS